MGIRARKWRLHLCGSTYKYYFFMVLREIVKSLVRGLTGRAGFAATILSEGSLASGEVVL